LKSVSCLAGKHIPIYRWALGQIPASISRKVMPGYYQLREVCIHSQVLLRTGDQYLTFVSQKATASVTELVAERDAGKRLPAKPDEGTVLDLLLTPRPKHNHDIPGPGVLVDEGCAFIVGGSDTTGYTMEGATYLVLSHPGCLKRLRDELDAAMPAIRDYDLQTVLELPFLVFPDYSLKLPTFYMIALTNSLSPVIISLP
jgi:hypothetical protein